MQEASAEGTAPWQDGPAPGLIETLQNRVYLKQEKQRIHSPARDWP